jgi:ABC-type sugar transport system permease subunit
LGRRHWVSIYQSCFSHYLYLWTFPHLVFRVCEFTQLAHPKGDYVGLKNFVRAFDSLAYILAFWIVVILVYLAIRTIRNLWGALQVAGGRAWVWALPALVVTGGLAKFLQFLVLLLPEILGIAQKVRGQQVTQELFISLLGEAWNMPVVQGAFRLALLILALGLTLAYLVRRWIGRDSRHVQFFTGWINVYMLVGIAAVLGWLTWTEIQTTYAGALAEGVQLEIWAQVVTISAGFLLLLLSWLVWRSAGWRESTFGMGLRLAGAAMLAVGAWVLIGELPRLIGAGDKGWWLGLQVTVYYSVGTVPIQLALAMFLAVLLFQNLKGRSLFRLIYFLPYITPAVAAAAVFRVIFSSRPTAPLNSMLSSLGFNTLRFLDEPTGILRLIFGAGIPDWLTGPSLALVVVIIYNIWSFVGYDIVIFLAGLGGIPGELYEAADIDGAGRFAKFRHITFPLLSPTTYFLTLLSIIGTFKAFNHVWVLRSAAALGTVDTASIVIFTEFNRNTRYGYAAALALLLFLIILVLTIINNRIAEKRVFYG